MSYPDSSEQLPVVLNIGRRRRRRHYLYLCPSFNVVQGDDRYLQKPGLDIPDRRSSPWVKSLRILQRYMFLDHRIPRC
jgi:hypothetical protein